MTFLTERWNYVCRAEGGFRLSGAQRPGVRKKRCSVSFLPDFRIKGKQTYGFAAAFAAALLPELPAPISSFVRASAP